MFDTDHVRSPKPVDNFPPRRVVTVHGRSMYRFLDGCENVGLPYGNAVLATELEFLEEWVLWAP